MICYIYIYICSSLHPFFEKLYLLKAYIILKVIVIFPKKKSIRFGWQLIMQIVAYQLCELLI